MAFKCGHCNGRHDTAAEGLKCFNQKLEARRNAAGDDSPKTPDFIKKEVDAQPGHMRPDAQKFLGDLLRQFGLMLTNDMTPETIPWQDGKKILSGLINARRLKASSKPYSLPDGVLHDPIAKHGGERRPTPQKLPDCPPGHYAINSLTGNNDLDFFKVDRPTEGQWAGRTFIKRIIGGRPDSPVHGKTAREAIEAILDVGPEDAGILYGTKLGRCMRCNRHLTDELSRALGIGPECRSKS